MNKFKDLLICTDLDGTLLNSKNEISRENLEAIEYFKHEGGYFTFITGRMPSFAGHIYDKVKPNAPIGCINGGGVYDYETKKYLWTQPISDSVIELVEYIDQNIDGMGIQVNTFDTVYFCAENQAQGLFRKITGLEKINKHYNDIKEPIAKIVFVDSTEEKMEKLAQLLCSHKRADEFRFVRSEKWLYEILPKGISKAVVMPKIAQHLNISPNNCIAIGDYNNDIQMVKDAKTGIAVANAVDELKAVADYITVSNDDHAIAQVISDIEKGKIPIINS